MEIQIPEDFAKKAVEIKTVLDSVTQQIVDQFKMVVPSGFTLKIDGNNLVVYKNKPEHPMGIPYVSINETSIYVPKSRGGHFGNFAQLHFDQCTPDDVFKLSPLLQILTVIDVNSLPEITIIGDEHEN